MRSKEDPRHGADAFHHSIRRVGRQVKIERRQHQAGVDRNVVAVRAARVEPDTRRRTEHDHGVLAINASNKRDPLTRPVERTRILDRHES